MIAMTTSSSMSVKAALLRMVRLFLSRVFKRR
jgi:hypothetical protein